MLWIWLLRCMFMTFLLCRHFHSTLPSQIGMQQNPDMGWSYKISEQLFEDNLHGVFISFASCIQANSQVFNIIYSHIQ